MDFIENIRDIHIGTIIQGKLTEKSMTKTELADRINKERSTVYDIFDRKSIDIELLIDISKALDYDFLRNVYFKEQTVHTIHISIKTEEDVLKNIDLLKELICYVRNKK
jgi:predicted transcriptional regulator